MEVVVIVVVDDRRREYLEQVVVIERRDRLYITWSWWWLEVRAVVGPPLQERNEEIPILTSSEWNVYCTT